MRHKRQTKNVQNNKARDLQGKKKQNKEPKIQAIPVSSLSVQKSSHLGAN